MPTIVLDAEGNEHEVFSPDELKARADAAVAARETELKAEHEKALADKDAHVAEKLDQFKRGQGSVDTEKEAVKLMAEEAKRTAEEAKAAIAAAEADKISTKRDYWIKSVTGGDPELTKKILENYDILNMPAGTDDEISARVQKAVQASGVSSFSSPSMSFSGAIPPNFAKTDQSVKEHNYEVWKNELGIQDLIPKKNNQ